MYFKIYLCFSSFGASIVFKHIEEGTACVIFDATLSLIYCSAGFFRLGMSAFFFWLTAFRNHSGNHIK